MDRLTGRVCDSDRILGCLMGGAVGDAVGYQVEFDRLDEILARRGQGGVLGPEPGQPLLASDDTQMTLFTLQGLTRALQVGNPDHDGYVEAVHASYLEWFGTQGEADGAGPLPGGLASLAPLRHRRAPGLTCMGALELGATGTPGCRINDSKGCGGVMRVAPVGFLPALDAEAAFDVGARTAALTHGHIEGWTSAGAMAVIVQGALRHGRTASLEALCLGAAEMASRLGGHHTADLASKAVYLARLGPLTPQGIVQELGEGWTGDEALAVGIHAALAGKDFKDAIRIAATHSGDSDSTASIAGQILGARDGSGCVPTPWFAGLDLGGIVRSEAAAFIQALGQDPDPASGTASRANAQDRSQDTTRRGLWSRVGGLLSRRAAP